ncbi:MAG: restriction endonuclease [Campylobacterota bacterium]|nr:restriction endonuclease [Campylobacterota bacterium]
MLEHEFTKAIYTILEKHFGDNAHDIYLRSPLLQYLNSETRGASRESKARKSNGNLFALYALVLDYRNQGYHAKQGYSDTYQGARFTDLKKVANSLAGGAKLQNHAFNHRLNEKFKKLFQECPYQPIIRDLSTKRYWINENLINIDFNKQNYNISKEVLLIIEQFIIVVREEFENFIKYTTQLATIASNQPDRIKEFIVQQLSPSSDARTFEIVSYAILKNHYKNQHIYWGWEADKLTKEHLHLYKTGRTNANDGGIDFVMKPLGRFFQVTETLDFKKYFLDIDKVQKFPISFVVKTKMSHNDMLQTIKENATQTYQVKRIVEQYMNAIEEIFNIDDLIYMLKNSEDTETILSEIILQSRIEFNYDT